MAEEFDKEIDSLLRQAARRGETVSEIAAPHLDADEINAFAEHALPEKGRVRTIEHLADCARCREILSNLTTFNTEPASEIFPVSVTKTVSVPWYKRLFVFPQIAYAMALAVLIFAGIVAVVVLKNSTENSSLEVARVDEKAQTANPVSSAANNNSASSNAAPAANSNAATAVSPDARNKINPSAIAADSSAARNRNAVPAKPAPNSAAPSNESEKTEKEKTEAVAAAPPARENNYAVDGASNDSVSARRQSKVPQNSVSQNQSSNLSTTTAPDAEIVQSSPVNGRAPQSMRAMKNRAETKAENAAPSAKDSDEAAESKSVGGKDFRRAEDVWYDVKYRGQPTVNIRRGSNDYEKLDAGLRSIADNLGGAVVIVWKDKAYRIQ